MHPHDREPRLGRSQAAQQCAEAIEAFLDGQRDVELRRKLATEHADAATGQVLHPRSALIAGRPQAVATNPDGHFQLFRVGDAVSSRNIHAAIYDSLRLCKDL